MRTRTVALASFAYIAAAALLSFFAGGTSAETDADQSAAVTAAATRNQVRVPSSADERWGAFAAGSSLEPTAEEKACIDDGGPVDDCYDPTILAAGFATNALGAGLPPESAYAVSSCIEARWEARDDEASTAFDSLVDGDYSAALLKDLDVCVPSAVIARLGIADDADDHALCVAQRWSLNTTGSDIALARLQLDDAAMTALEAAEISCTSNPNGITGIDILGRGQPVDGILGERLRPIGPAASENPDGS